MSDFPKGHPFEGNVIPNGRELTREDYPELYKTLDMMKRMDQEGKLNAYNSVEELLKAEAKWRTERKNETNS